MRYAYREEHPGEWWIWLLSEHAGDRLEVVDYADSKEEAQEKVDALHAQEAV